MVKDFKKIRNLNRDYKMLKTYKIASVKKPKDCHGCKKVIEKGSSCVYQLGSWRGVPYKAYYQILLHLRDISPIVANRDIFAVFRPSYSQNGIISPKEAFYGFF